MNTAIIILQDHIPTSVHHAADEFVKLDPFGIGMAIIAMTIVFSVLVIVYITFKYLSRLQNMNFKKVMTKGDFSKRLPETEAVPEEVCVAIALALHIYKSQLQEKENLTLTIDTVSRRYSPWSSKIYTLRQLPR